MSRHTSSTDGMMAAGSRNDTEVLVQKNGVLRFQTKNTQWADAEHNGTFLYKNVEGDFVAVAEIANFPGWKGQGRNLGNNEASLMMVQGQNDSCFHRPDSHSLGRQGDY